MHKRQKIKYALALGFILFFLLSSTVYALKTDVSGSLKNGYRILTIDPALTQQSFTVFRGDYVKFKLPQGLMTPELLLAGVKQEKQLNRDLEQTPFFKMKTVGLIPFQINPSPSDPAGTDPIQGQIRVLEYAQHHYRTMTAKEADLFIKSEKPLILDVRTPREYNAARIENSVLIPVQALRTRIEELQEHKTGPILVYCASGNRSTVASKILIDRGFTNIINLKYGIKDWYQRKFKITR